MVETRKGTEKMSKQKPYISKCHGVWEVLATKDIREAEAFLGTEFNGKLRTGR